eukprot:scaffold437546_cov28-Prasinocladus_malaysianus.AAC.1
MIARRPRLPHRLNRDLHQVSDPPPDHPLKLAKAADVEGWTCRDVLNDKHLPRNSVIASMLVPSSTSSRPLLGLLI